MGPQALAICWLAGLRYQDLAREAAPGRRTAPPETTARRRPRTAFLALVAVFARTLVAPAAARGEVQPIAAAPVRIEC
jgi:hypothetical protein